MATGNFILPGFDRRRTDDGRRRVYFRSRDRCGRRVDISTARGRPWAWLWHRHSDGW